MKINFDINIKHWFAIVGVLLPLVFGGVFKSYDIILHNFLGVARNNEEIYQRHMTVDHLLAGEEVEKKGELIADDDFRITTWLYKDGCAIIRYVEGSGRVSAYKILPSPAIVNMLKLGQNPKGFSLLMGVVEASNSGFNLGLHTNGRDFHEKYVLQGSNVFVLRYYSDGCVLTYMIDAYGYTYKWYWRYYSH